MDIVGGVKQAITRTADATTAAAGAVGGAAVNGVIGGVQGTVSGVRDGISSGSRSTPAAALTLGVIGAAGLVEWPVLLAIGGTALVVHQLSRRADAQSTGTQSTLASVVSPRLGDGSGSAAPRTAAPRKSAPRKSAARNSSPRKSAQRSKPGKTTTSGRRRAPRSS